MDGSTATKDLSGLRHAVLEKYRTETLGLLIVAATTFLFFQLHDRGGRQLASIEAEMQGARAEITRINAEIEAAENLRRTIETASDDLRRLEDRLNNLKEKLPSDKQISRILAEISDSEQREDLKILSIKPLPIEEKGELARLPFQVTVETRFTSLGDYIERIENLPRLMVVDNLMIEPKAESPRTLTMQMYLSAYILTL